MGISLVGSCDCSSLSQKKRWGSCAFSGNGKDSRRRDGCFRQSQVCASPRFNAWKLPRKLGLPIGNKGVTFHSLRKTWASRMGPHTPVRILQILGGWSSLKMVEDYCQ
ncbi:MAG: tyrosine-type recombinase/integrase, partial [Nitrospiraceae bacterium]